MSVVPAVASVFQRVSTRSVPADARFDLWRNQFMAARVERPRRPGADDFHGEMLGTAWQDVVFADLHGDPVTSHFGERGNGVVLLGYVRAGSVDIRCGRDTVTSVDARSGAVLFDCDRPFVTASQRHAITYLALPSALVAEVLGADPVRRGEATRALPPSAMSAGFLRQLLGIAENGERLTAAETTEAMHTARSLALAALAASARRWRSLPETFDGALVAAARHQLRMHAGNPLLTAADVAAMLGCSRAHLYRLFAREDRTVAGELREARLGQARRMIESQPGEAIGAVAWRCGYTDFSAFTKAFRRRFGMTPGDCRDQRMSGASWRAATG